MGKVVLENLTKRFGDVLAVNDLSLTIEDGEFFVFLGPSGSGKTTTLRLIAGLEKADEGNIYIGDTLVNDLEPRERKIAMVFQSYALYPHMKVRDNISFSLKLAGVSKEEILGRTKEIAEMLRIQALLDRMPRELSGGQMQRVALGRAIIRNPSAFLLDEPLSNLDAILRVQMRAELLRLHKKLGVTTVYVTHDQSEATVLGDRIAVMDEGLLQQVGSPNEVYTRPENLFVAKFIGSPSMNTFEGSIVEKNGKIICDMASFSYPLSKELSGIVTKTDISEILLGIRPEDIKIVRKIQEDAIEAEVEITEMIGAHLFVHLRVGEKMCVVETTSSEEFSSGEKVWLLFNNRKLHIFDAKNKKSILLNPSFVE